MSDTAGGMQAAVKIPRSTLIATKTSKLSTSPATKVELDHNNPAIPRSCTLLTESVILPMNIPNKAVGPNIASPDKKL